MLVTFGGDPTYGRRAGVIDCQSILACSGSTAGGRWSFDQTRSDHESPAPSAPTDWNQQGDEAAAGSPY